MTEHQKASLLTNHLDLLICTFHQNSSNNKLKKKEVGFLSFFIFLKINYLSKSPSIFFLSILTKNGLPC